MGPIRDSRAGASQALENEKAWSFFALEVLVISVAYGWKEQSWLSGFIMFFILLALIAIPVVKYIFAAFMTFAWGAVAYTISDAIGKDNERTFVITAVVSLISAAIHFASVQYAGDLMRDD